MTDTNDSGSTSSGAATLGYATVYVDDVPATLGFFRAAFHLSERFVTPEHDYAELSTGETTLAFAANDLAASNLTTGGGFTRLDPASPPPGVSITLIVDDVAVSLQAAIDAGARPYVDPTVKPWGQTVAYVVSPEGLLIEIATAVPA